MDFRSNTLFHFEEYLLFFIGPENFPDAINFKKLVFAELGVAAGYHYAAFRGGFVCPTYEVAGFFFCGFSYREQPPSRRL